MSYPDEIIEVIQKKYFLDDFKIQQLRDTLQFNNVRVAIENFNFNPENLLIKVGQDSEYISVFSPIVANKIIENPELLDPLRTYISCNIDHIKAWDLLRVNIKKLNDFGNSYKHLTEKKILAFSINNDLAPLTTFLVMNDVLKLDFIEISPRLPQYMNAILHPIKIAASMYFENLFEREKKIITNISFAPKKSGLQLGVQMHITFKEIPEDETSTISAESTHEKIITYHIKTHQNGSTSENSSIKPVDLKELFIYKLLEFTGYGPKTHFFYNLLSSSGFYIATQDLGFTKAIEKNKTFTLFQEVSKEANINFAAPHYEEARKAIISLDIISRILRLKDTTTNQGNFGVVTVNNDRSKWKILDFRVTDDSEYYLSPQIMESLKEGNGVFNYIYSNFTYYIFKDKDYQVKRMELSKQVVDELNLGKLCQTGRKMAFPKAIEKVYNEIIDYVIAHKQNLNLNFSLVIEDLNKYTKAITENFEILTRGVNCEAELLSESSAAAISPPKIP